MASGRISRPVPLSDTPTLQLVYPCTQTDFAEDDAHELSSDPDSPSLLVYTNPSPAPAQASPASIPCAQVIPDSPIPPPQPTDAERGLPIIRLDSGDELDYDVATYLRRNSECVIVRSDGARERTTLLDIQGVKNIPVDPLPLLILLPFDVFPTGIKEKVGGEFLCDVLVADGKVKRLWYPSLEPEKPEPVVIPATQEEEVVREPPKKKRARCSADYDIIELGKKLERANKGLRHLGKKNIKA